MKKQRVIRVIPAMTAQEAQAALSGDNGVMLALVGGWHISGREDDSGGRDNRTAHFWVYALNKPRKVMGHYHYAVCGFNTEDHCDLSVGYDLHLDRFAPRCKRCLKMLWRISKNAQAENTQVVVTQAVNERGDEMVMNNTSTGSTGSTGGQPEKSRLLVDISLCSRCGKNHKGMIFYSFTRPVIIEDRTFGYYGTCPETGEPVILEATVKDH